MQPVRLQFDRPNWRSRPTPACGDFLVHWPVHSVSRRSLNSSSNADFCASGHCRTSVGNLETLEPSDRIPKRRSGAIDPFLPVADFAANDRSTLKERITCIKDQGKRGTCAAFATVATVETLGMVAGDLPHNLSGQHAYYRGEVDGDILVSTGAMQDDGLYVGAMHYVGSSRRARCRRQSCCARARCRSSSASR
jgi:hypothetical protein